MKTLLNVSNCPILLVLVHYYNLHHFVFVQSKFIMMIKLLTAKINLGIYTSHVHVHDKDKIVLILISWISFQKYMYSVVACFRCFVHQCSLFWKMKWKINLIKAINQLINKNWMNWSKIYEHDNSEKTLSYKKCMLYKAEFSIHKHSKTNIISALINKNADGKMIVSTFFKTWYFS